MKCTLGGGGGGRYYTGVEKVGEKTCVASVVLAAVVLKCKSQ